jgi:hypothetical protein
MTAFKASDPKVETTFGIDPMLLLLAGVSFEAESPVRFSLTRPAGSAPGASRCSG